MKIDDLRNLVAKAAGVDVSRITEKARTGHQIKANALFEGSSSPASERVKVGLYQALDSPELAAEGAVRRLTMDIPFPEAVMTLFEGSESPSAEIYGYPDSQIADQLANAFGVSKLTMERPATTVNSGPPSPAPLDASHLVKMLSQSPNIILKGPPGTGKSSLAFELIRHLIGAADESVESCRLGQLTSYYPDGLDALIQDTDQAHLDKPVIWEMVQLHPGYSYEDLVRRLVPKSKDHGLKFVVEEGLLPQLCRLAAARGNEKPVVLILDEINRCDLSSCLGEFIFALDPGHRGTPVRLQYQADDLPSAIAVPPNLFVVGTMNTADRSIALVDYAIRRRFRFVNVEASYRALHDWYVNDTKAASVAEELMKASNAHLDERSSIGHSVFLVPFKNSDQWSGRMARQMVYHVIPVLREYQKEGLISSSAVSWRGISFGGETSRELTEKFAEAIKQALASK